MKDMVVNLEVAKGRKIARQNNTTAILQDITYLKFQFILLIYKLNSRFSLALFL